MTKRFTLAVGLGFCSLALSAQQFLQTEVLEFAVSPCGTFYTYDLPPAGYHPSAPFGFANGFGIVTDADADGWEVGSPAPSCGDYVAPGSPVEGFSIQVGDVFKTNNANQFFDPCESAEIFSNSLSSGPAGDFRLALWTGSRNGLSIRQSTVTKEGEAMMIHRVKLCNNTAQTVDSVFYQRYLEPDPDQTLSGNFATRHQILPDLLAGSGVEARGYVIDECRIAILSPDDRAQASFGGFFGDKPSFGYYGENFFENSGEAVGDVSIQMTFNLGSLEPGECDCAAFAYAFRRQDYDRAYSVAAQACSAFDAFETDGDEEALVSRLFGSNAQEADRDLTWLAIPGGFQLMDLRGDEQVRIYDLGGRLVQAVFSTGNVQTITGLPAGMYLIQVQDQTGSLRSGKAVVQ